MATATAKRKAANPVPAPSAERTVVTLSIAEIIRGDNDRTVFDPEVLKELASSIAEHGLLQPITVRPIEGTDTYQLIAGERRFRAVQLIGWTEISALIREASDSEASALMLAENVARADLDPVDEGLAYQKRIEQFGWSKKEVADRAGVSQSRVTARLKLLSCVPEVQHLCRKNQMSTLFAEMLAERSLPEAFQRKAMQQLIRNPKPTEAWWRDILTDLDSIAHQQEMFDDGNLLQVETFQLASQHFEPDPPHPTTTVPPVIEGTQEAILCFHIGYWEQAAECWHQRGKPHKFQECRAAAEAIKHLLTALPLQTPKRRSAKAA